MLESRRSGVEAGTERRHRSGRMLRPNKSLTAKLALRSGWGWNRTSKLR